ncbi:MAG TPA: nuclear transport factor 2 family protein [Longimicrobium sp.]|jgi:hypothetical protein
MRQYWILALAMLEAACRAVPARPVPDGRAGLARAEIERELRRMEEAARRKDAEGFVRADSVITIATPDGRSLTRTRAELVSDQACRWEAVVETREIRFDLDSLRVDGDSAVVFVRQRWERRLRGDDGAEHIRLTHAAHRETWVRRPAGWRTRSVRILGQGPNYTDGKPQ